jgi:hypothetical protein
MAEIAIVFNLAFAELEQDRYLEKAKAQIKKIKNQISNNGSSDRIVTVLEGYAGIYTQLNTLEEKDDCQRKAAWRITPPNCETSEYFPVSCKFYSIFARQKDRSIAHFFVGATAFIVIAITCLSYSSVACHEGFPKIIWWVFFVGLLFSLFFPPVMILFGRKMSSDLNKILSYIQNNFTNAARNVIDTTLDM